MLGAEGAEEASEMGEMGGIVCSSRSLPVLFGRLSCGGGTSWLLSPSSSTSETEFRLLSGESSAPTPNSAGMRGTGGTDDDRALDGEPTLARRRYAGLLSGCSPRGSVAESCRVMPPDLYLEARDSFDMENAVATSAPARVVPETADGISSVTAERGLGGALEGTGGGMPPESAPSEPSGEERCTLIFAPVTLVGILIGDGVGFREDGSSPF